MIFPGVGNIASELFMFARENVVEFREVCSDQ
jgi:hypothetical protein